MIEQWKTAGTDLTVAVSRFFDLSILLETKFTPENKDIHSLVSHIDSTLGIFQTTIDSKLTQARVALAKTRNRLTSPHSILSLPHDVLSEIFLNVVYARPRATKNMEQHVRSIYARLDSLLGVCAAWRHTGLNCGALWSIVPVVNKVTGRPYHLPLPTSLSLRRAGNSKGLYLAMSLTRDTHYAMFQFVGPDLSPFSAINIHEGINSTIPMTDVLRVLCKDGVPSMLSKLSLRYSGNNIVQQIGQPTGPLDQAFAQLEPRLVELVKSLSALRLQLVDLNWQNVVFSSRLVTLQIVGISLGCQPEINNFMLALASAAELRDFRLANIAAVPNQFTDIPAQILELPKLENLQLEGLAFNVLSLFIGAIVSPNAYRLTINLSSNVTKSYVLTVDSTIERRIIAKDEIYARLKGIKVDKLVLYSGKGSVWNRPANLQELLESVPSVKTRVYSVKWLSFHDNGAY